MLKQLAALWRDVSGAKQQDDDKFKYLIRKRDNTFWTDQKGGTWLPHHKKDKALQIKGADNAWDYVEKNLWEFAEDVDVVIP